MAVVGDFTPTETTDTSAEPDEFTYFGETFEIPASVGSGALLKFTWLIKQADGMSKRGEAAKRRAVSQDAKIRAQSDLIDAELTASSAMYEMLHACLGADQIDAFLRTADANGVTAEGLMEVCDRIQEVIGARPTKRSADSSAGPLTTGTPSTAGGSGPTEPMSDRDRQVAQILAESTSPVGLPV